jgi:two-component system cell cycle sensor histidine kinase/response regulator CckA
MDQHKVPESSRSKGSEVVMAVDEEDLVRNLAHVILETSGYVVLEARDSHEALALCALHQGPIDLLVTDLMISELGGHELAERALKLRPNLKFMFMHTDDTDDAALKKNGLDGSAFLQKPFTPVGLAERVREALDSKAHAGQP